MVLAVSEGASIVYGEDKDGQAEVTGTTIFTRMARLAERSYPSLSARSSS